MALLAGTETRDRFVPTEFAGLSLAALPAAIGVAVLRYGLYEIDLLINRTLVYGSLTVTLVALYVGASLYCSGSSLPSQASTPP